VTERVAAGLGPDGEAVRLPAYANAFHLARRRVDSVNDVVKTAGEPQHLAVTAHVAHIGTAASRELPTGNELARSEVDHGNAAVAARRAVNSA